MRVRHASRPSRALSGVAFSVGLGSMSIAGNVILLPIIVFSVGADEYGIWLFALALILYLSYLDFGTGTALAHFLARGRGEAEIADHGRLVPTSFGIAALAFVAGSLPLIAASLAFARTHDGEATIFIPALIAFASVATKPALSILQGVGDYVLDRQLHMVALVLRIAGTVVVCVWWPSLFAVAMVEALAMLLPSVLALPFALARVRATSPPHAGPGFRAASAMLLSYGARSMSVALVGASLLQGGTLIVGLMGSSAAVTYWNAAFRIYTAARQANAWIVAPFLPALTRLFVQHRDQAMRMTEVITLTSVVATGLAAGVVIPFSPQLVPLWLGPDVPAIEIAATTSILLAGLVLNCLHGPLTLLGDATGRPGVFFLPQLIWLVAFLASSYPLYQVLGVAGVALALSAPLPVIEWLYLSIGQQRLKLSKRRWSKAVLAPAARTVAPAGALAGATWLSLQGSDAQAVATAGVFLAASISLLVLFRRYLSFAELRRALRAEL